MRFFSFDRWTGCLLPLIFLIAVALRLISLDADPPSTVGLHFLSDEGWWVHNARNKVLFDNWVMDEFNQSLLASPPFCMATYGIYSLFGVSYGTSRLVPVLSGLLTLLLFAGILHIHSPPSTVILATLLFGWNFGFTSLNRTAYVDSTALLFLMVSWWLMEKLPHRVWAVFLAGMSFALAVFTKSYMLSVLPPAMLILFLRIRTQHGRRIAGTLFLNTVLFCGGVFSVYILWRKYLYFPFLHDYQIMYSLWQDGNIPGTFVEALRNIPSFIVGHHGNKLIPARFFGLNASLLLLAGYRVFSLLTPRTGTLRSAWMSMPKLDRECMVFFTILSIQIAPMTAKPFRRYLLLYIPLVILAARTILPVTNRGSAGSPDRLLRAIRTLVPCLIFVILCAPFFVRIVPAGTIPIDKLWVLVSAVIFSISALFFHYVRHRTILRSSWTLPVVVAVFLLLDGGFHVHSLMTRSFTLRDTSRRLGAQYLTPSTIILGGIAGSLCLENQARSLTIWGREEAPRVFNQDPIRRFSPDYLIILRKLDGLEWVPEDRYEKYARPENYLETIRLLPDGDGFRAEADLYSAPRTESRQADNPRLNI